MKKILSNALLISCALFLVNCASSRKPCSSKDSCAIKKAEKSCCESKKESCGDSCETKK